ncbi:MAG: S8 family peptidase [Bacteroidales bacterium]|nr:S8 family peptidase [Bacteroidales bacterium]
MKKQLLFLLMFFLIQSLFAQNIGVGLKGYLNSEGKKSSILFSEKYSYRNFDGVKHISAIIKVNDEFDENELLKNNSKIGSRIGNILTVYIPLDRVRDVLKIKGMDEIETSRKVSSPHLIKAASDLGADLVWQGFDLPSPYSGKDVIIGITDWGFDYTHPMFYDTLLNNYRIIAAWDQFRNQGPSPSGYLYGTVFEGKQALLGAQCDTSNIYQYGYHGTHVAGIASGGGATTNYRGIAYGSELLFATFLIDEAGVLDAYSWMRGIAQDKGKRLVVNGSWGLYNIGLMDGTSMFDQAIDSMSLNDNIVFVTSGGNNGNTKFHIKADFNFSDTVSTGIGFDIQNTVEKYWGQSLTLSGDSTDRFSARLEFYDGNFQLVHASRWVNTISNDYIADTLLIIGNDSIIYRSNSVSSTPISNRPIQEWAVRLSNSQLGQYFVILSIISPNGYVHAWNVACLSTGVGNWGLDFKKYRLKDIEGDFYYSIGEPAVCKTAITVAAHLSRPRDAYSGGSRANFSSIGPTIDGRIKPEVSAPGVGVFSSISSFASQDFSSNNLITFEGRDYPFAPLSGTSMSSPMVTGVVALMLEANPNLSSEKIKEILIETARQDSYTTSTIPNDSWGWGKVSAHDAVKRAVELIGLDNEIESSPKLTLYPNPMLNELNIVSTEKLKYVEIYDMFGRKLIEKDNNTNLIDVSSLRNGVYIVTIHLESKLLNYKIIKR